MNNMLRMQERPSSNDSMFHSKYMKKGQIKVKTVSSGKQPLILAICTPIMAHAHRYASELVFLAATSRLD